MGSDGLLEAPPSPCSSVCSEIRAEETWRECGESLAKSRISEKTIVEKEQQLRQYIQKNYSRIKGVENELDSMQREMQMADGPKRSALEMLRKKIEEQNEKVLEARARHRAARRFLASTEEQLQAAESVKERLCSELNLVVQQSARAQLQKLEQLTERLEKVAQADPNFEVDTKTSQDGGSSHLHISAAQKDKSFGRAVLATQTRNTGRKSPGCALTPASTQGDRRIKSNNAGLF